MTVSNDHSRSPIQRLAALFRTDEEPSETPGRVVVGLGLVTAVLVAASTVSAIQTGHAAIGMSFLAAVGLFLGAVGVFEAEKRLGGD